jgi:hypothetical protein
MFLTDSKPSETMTSAGELMTKSKGIGRGGHRKGAGRPRFAKTGKTSYFSTRLTPKTRSLLEAEARRRGRSLSELAEDLLQLGLEEIADLERPKPLRALLFLVSTLESRTLGPHWQDAKYSWRSNPYMFAALRAGIIDLLDRLRPPGEFVTPSPGPEEEEWYEDDEGGSAGTLRRTGTLWRHTFPDSPEQYARTLVQQLVSQAQSSEWWEQTRMERGTELAYWEDVRSHYGFVDAQRDLFLIKPRGRK